MADLPPEVTVCSGPWMERLTRAIGPLRAPVRHGKVEPDGGDGVIRRSPFDRVARPLLAASLVLACRDGRACALTRRPTGVTATP